MSFPNYRKNYLPAMTLEAIRELPDKEEALVIIPTGAIEQHGPHLPVGVDAFMGQGWLNGLFANLREGLPVYVSPPVTIGKSNEHTGFPGTLIVEASVLHKLILAIFEQCYAWGFKRFGFLNTHGGNTSSVRLAMREIQGRYADARTWFLRSGYSPRISEQEASYGFHAGQVETAWMMALVGERVDAASRPHEYPGKLEDPGELRPELAPATFSWVTADISESGAIGAANEGTTEDGELWYQEGSAALARSIEEIFSDNES